MAQKVKLAKGKEFNFEVAKGGGASKYPWDEWFNGDLLLLERSDVIPDPTDPKKAVLDPEGVKRDFECPRDAMPGKLKSAARRKYKVVQISRHDADGHKLTNDGLIIRARDMTQEERAAEDILRAEEKEYRKELEAEKKTNGGAPALATDEHAAA